MHQSTLPRLLALCAGAAPLLMTGLALADDTEVYVAEVTSALQPNILFIMDTSGSMHDPNNSITTENPYDSEEDYPGSCNDARIYWSSNGSPPDCDTSRWILESVFGCDAAKGALAGDTGFYQDRASQYRDVVVGWRFIFPIYGLRWVALESGDHSAPVDCQADDNVESNWDDGTYTFWNANYLNYLNGGFSESTRTRYTIVQEAATRLVDSISNVNIGLMRFDEDGKNPGGGYVALPIGDIATNRAEFKRLIGTNGQWESERNPYGGTPLSETLLEAARYFRGEGVNFGRYTAPATSAPASRSGWTYRSPFAGKCQKNYIVFLTDGKPEGDVDSHDDIRALIGKSCTPNSGGDQNGKCLDDLAEYLNTVDQSASIDDDQLITTHVIGFAMKDLGSGNTQLVQDTAKSAATRGGGKYYTADSYFELQEAFNQIIVDIISRSGLFTSPAVSVNAFNRLEHRDSLYFALFEPTESTRWPGNLKQYKFFADADGERVLDKNGNSAVNPATGIFAENAQSLWSEDPDGDRVIDGGAANRLSLTRNLYSYFGTDSNISLAGSSLTDELTTVLTGTGTLLSGLPLLGEAVGPLLDQIEDVTEFIAWAGGTDVLDEDGDGNTSEPRKRMGDPLHSRPVLVTYSGDDTNPDTTVFFTTNEGFFHAIDGETGDETFSFLPKELLPNLMKVYLDEGIGKNSYGLDGAMASWIDDRDRDGVINQSEKKEDSVYLFFGMRRGGENFYGMNVTNRAAPRLMWTLSAANGALAELGQSWGRPVVTRMRIDGTAKTVLVLSGGYDPDQDDASVREYDDEGRAIYVVDALTGALLWSGGSENAANKLDFSERFEDMNYSIPAEVRTIDIDGDGMADQLWAGDMGGQLWRFDVNNNATGSDKLITGGVVAELATNEAAGARRFYYPPSVALVREGPQLVLAVAIGSGWRAHPLDTVIDDRFYVLRDPNVYAPPVDEDGDISYTTLTAADFYDATANLVGQGTEAQRNTARAALAAKPGWFIELERGGEKVMSESAIVNERVIFTTYEPEPVLNDACTGGLGNGYYYALDLFNAAPDLPLNDGADDDPATDDALDKADRSQRLNRPGLPPAPVVYFMPGGGIRVLVGPEILPSPAENPTRRTFWVRAE